MDEKFCLKWNDFDSNVSKSFGLLRNEGYLHDVTLVGDDNKQVSAHKLVLSASSEYFKNIFQNNNKHAHPLLCLDGIASEELGNIMDYIYNGEVKIYQESLDRFLTIAQRLQLNGLIGTENGDSVKKNESEDSSFMDQNDVMTSESKDEVVNATYSSFSQPPKDRRRTRDTNEKHTIAVNGVDYSDIDKKANEYLETLADGSLKCTVCGKVAEKARNVRQNMKWHVETHLDGISISCQLCGKDFRSRHSLKNHKTAFHRFNNLFQVQKFS